MSDLQSVWTPEQVQHNASEANENLAEARTTDRFSVPGQATGVSVQSGENTEPDTVGHAEAAGIFTVPADPPRGETDRAGA